MTNRTVNKYGKARELEPEEVAHLLATAAKGTNGERNVMMIRFTLNCALRISEACGATVGEIFSANGKVKAEWQLVSSKQKGGETTTIPIPKVTQERLEAYFKSEAVFGREGDPRREPTRPLFASTKSNNGWFMLPNAGVQLMTKLFKEAGIEGAKSHSFRRTKATALDRAGTRLRVIQEVLRHKNLGTTQKYLTVTRGDHRTAMEAAVF